MRIGILGTGTLATALATGWVRAGHDVVVGGRSPERAGAAAEASGAAARPLQEVARGADAVLLAVHWQGIADVLKVAGVAAGTPLVDPSNAVEHGVGVRIGDPLRIIAESAPGAAVVK